MTDNTITTERAVDFVRDPYAQPFDLVVDGTVVPNVTGSKFIGNDEYARQTGDPSVVGREFVSFTVDRRLGFDIPAEHSDTVARLVADAVAVSLGYACHPRPDHERAVPRTPYQSRADFGDLERAEARPYHNGLLDLPDCKR